MFVDRVSELKELQFDADNIDAYHLTRSILAQEQEIQLPKGVTYIEMLAAYNSCKGIKSDFVISNKNEALALQAYLIGRKLAIPNLNRNEDSLRCAIDLSNDSEFQKKRAEFFDWQDYIIAKGYSAKQAVEYIEQLTQEYNVIVKKAENKVYYRFAFTLAGIGLGLAGALGNPIAATSALLAIMQFATYDRNPVIEAGNSKAVAMFHDVEEVLELKFKK